MPGLQHADKYIFGQSFRRNLPQLELELGFRKIPPE
jgi:hypothetical protein